MTSNVNRVAKLDLLGSPEVEAASRRYFSDEVTSPRAKVQTSTAIVVNIGKEMTSNVNRVAKLDLLGSPEEVEAASRIYFSDEVTSPRAKVQTSTAIVVNIGKEMTSNVNRVAKLDLLGSPEEVEGAQDVMLDCQKELRHVSISDGKYRGQNCTV